MPRWGQRRYRWKDYQNPYIIITGAGRIGKSPCTDYLLNCGTQNVKTLYNDPKQNSEITIKEVSTPEFALYPERKKQVKTF